jgi:hypothetical protein
VTGYTKGKFDGYNANQTERNLFTDTYNSTYDTWSKINQTQKCWDYSNTIYLNQSAINTNATVQSIFGLNVNATVQTWFGTNFTTKAFDFINTYALNQSAINTNATVQDAFHDYLRNNSAANFTTINVSDSVIVGNLCFKGNTTCYNGCSPCTRNQTYNGTCMTTYSTGGFSTLC